MQTDLTAAPDAVVTAPMPVRMSLLEALEHAQVLQRSEKLDVAESIYLEILQQLPDEPNTHRFLGILRQQQGRTDEAVSLLCRAIELAPDDAGSWINLGNVLIEAERFHEGAEALRRAIQIDAESAAVYNNFGIACMRCGDISRSETAFQEGLKIEPDRADLHFNYARLLYVTGRYRESAAHSLQAVAADPSLVNPRKILAMSHFILGEKGKAVEHLLAWRQVDPGNPEIDHHLAACGGETPERASDQYVARVFDDFAASFDRKLAQLGYRAPTLVLEALGAVGAMLPPQAAILDAGCGTGLCGPLLAPFAGRLDGVDLSGGMLEKARERACYQALHQAELTSYLLTMADTYDVIVSADTLCYFGDLNDFLSAARQALRGPGVLVFSLEALFDEAQQHRLDIQGRYSHSKAYVLRVLALHGFAVEAFTQAVLRHELHEPVQGWIVTAVRGPTPRPDMDMSRQIPGSTS